MDFVLFAAAAVAAPVSSARGQALSLPSFGSDVYNITVSNPSINGGVPASTGSSDNSTALNAYISYCSTHGGGTVEIPAGTFTSSAITILGNVNLQIDGGGILRDSNFNNTLIQTNGSSTSNMEISGSGVIDGAATTTVGSNKLIDITKVSTLEITGVSIENSGNEHLVTENDSNVTISNVTIADPGTLAANGGSYLVNTDGIDYWGGNFTIKNCNVNDGDDDIVAKPASGACSNILVTNDTIGAGHGISVGGGTANGLTHMTVTNCTLNGTTYGLRLKAEDASTDAGGGTLHPTVGVTFSGIVMTNVAQPIVIDSFYDGGDNFPSSATQTNHAVDSNTPMWENIGFSNITVTGSSNGGELYDLNTTPSNLEGLSFDSANITSSSAMKLWWGTNINESGLTVNHTINSADLTNVTAPGPVNITWNNTGVSVGGTSLGDGATWDIVANQNWNNGSTFITYTNSSNVTFSDANNAHYNVTLNTTVSPLSTTINNSAGTYTISGAGMIAGAGSLTKTGTSAATISTSNAYTGGTVINGGTLTVGSANALGALETLGAGAKPGATTVNATGSLDLNGHALVEPITLNGGTLTNNSAATASVVGGVKGVGYATTSAGIGAGSTINFSSGAAAATPILGIGAASFSGFTGTYTSAPSVIITPSDGSGSGAMATAVLTGNTLTGISIFNPGSGYDAAPIITFTGGTGTVAGAATGNAINFTIVGIQTSSAGSEYTSAPTAALQNNGGAGAVALTPVIGSVTLAATSSIGGNAGNISLGLPVTGAGGLIKTGSDTLTLSAANSYSGGTNVSAGLLEIQPTSPTTSALPSGPVSITGGTLQIATNVTLGSQSGSTPASNVNITSLSITGNGTFDITNNHIIINYGSGPDPIGSIAAWIVQGFASGTWTGAGIMSTAEQSNSGSYGIGYADAADPGNPAGLAPGQIEVMYTLLGDANLDGKVNGTDFNIMAANFNTGADSWDQGDFTYDGKVNGSDFNALSENFNQGATQSADLSALDSFAAQNGINPASVPEPACTGIMVMAGLGVLRRRRRR